VPEEGPEAGTPAALLPQASARKALPSASLRRSLSRTPGARVVIVERSTPASARTASAPKAGATAVEAACQPTPRLLSTIAIQTEAEDVGDDVEQEVQERSGEGGCADADVSLDLPGGLPPGCCWLRALSA
jgi:hypothetical protein